jgi:4-alpha-glucanotransferase
VVSRRHSGLLVPLFSIPSSRSWGVGEIPDIETFGAWLRSAGQDLWQLLPVNEMAEGQHSPYSALSAMAIDPIFISLDLLEDYAALGGEATMDESARLDLAEVRSTRTIDYDTIRALKDGALRESFERFLDVERAGGTPRAEAFAAFCAQEAWWLDDYALFRALHARFVRRWWREWDADISRRDPDALARARRQESREILFRQYLQWVAAEQWARARQAAGVLLCGDFPFMVSGDSADVWAHQSAFDLDASIGAPPDAFAPDGQDWGMPAYRWDVMREREFAWLRERARRAAELFDGFRVDHLVGFYRTYIRPPDRAPRFTPEREPDQIALGEQVLSALAAPGACIIAEDLGTVPDFVRASLACLGIPGYKVLRWEREWNDPACPFRDPAAYPAVSVATTGTHDTEPLAVWWDALTAGDREGIGELPLLRAHDVDWAAAGFTATVRDALLETVVASGSDFLILPIQDVFGWRDRINVPGTISDDNWTWRLPWSVDTLGDEPEAVERAGWLREASRRARRGGYPGASGGTT